MRLTFVPPGACLRRRTSLGKWVRQGKPDHRSVRSGRQGDIALATFGDSASDVQAKSKMAWLGCVKGCQRLLWGWDTWTRVDDHDAIPIGFRAADDAYPPFSTDRLCSILDESSNGHRQGREIGENCTRFDIHVEAYRRIAQTTMLQGMLDT